MRRLRAFALRVAGVFRLGRRDPDFAEEMQSHLQLHIDDNLRAGMTPEQARREALLKLGGVDVTTESYRDRRGLPSVETLLQDIRFGARLLVRTPGFTIAAVLTLALGIGANSAIFTVVNGVLLRPLPYRDPERLVMVWEWNLVRDRRTNVVGPANYFEWRDRQHVFEGLAAIATTVGSLTGGAEPEQVRAQAVTSGFFPVLGVNAHLGRTLVSGDDEADAPDVAVISHRLWQRRYGGDPSLVGRTVDIDATPYTVVGVMPPRFSFVQDEVDLWVPLQIPAAARNPRGRSLAVVARLAPGVTVERAQAEMKGISDALVRQWPAFNTGWTVNVVPLHEQLVALVRPALLVLMAAVGVVLLIACANVANLLLGRGAARQREFAVRAALGAGRGRLIRQTLVESLLLAVVGGTLGLTLATVGVRALVAAAEGRVPLPRLSDIRLDPWVAAFTAVVSIGTGIVFGLVPAFAASRASVTDALKSAGRTGSGDRRHTRTKDGLVVAQVALALVLLVGAGLLLRTLGHLLAVNPGFVTEGVLTFRASVPTARYPQPAQRLAFFRNLQERLATLPAVRAVGAVTYLPLTGLAAATKFTVDGRPAPPAGYEPTADVRIVAGDYFDAMGIPLVRGRRFTREDEASGRRVVIVNEALARQIFPGEDPIGRRLVISWGDTVPDEIVGIVGDTKHEGLDVQVRPMTYMPHVRTPSGSMLITLAASGDPLALAGPARQVVRALDPLVPVADLRSIDQVVAESVAQPRLTMMLLMVFAGIALVLAAVGIFGVLSYSVAQRTREIGIRAAVGAQPGQLLGLVMRRSLLLAGIGVALGLPAAAYLTRFLQSLLFDVEPVDPLTFGAVALLLVAVALVASFVPARRAMKVDPVEALRVE